MSRRDYIFFASYVQPQATEAQGLWGNIEAIEEMNGIEIYQSFLRYANRTTVALLTNFLSALELCSIIPQRFLLQTGAKHYALHLGPPTVPMMEDAPRVDHPNFYFAQEDALAAWSTKHATQWTVTRPASIIGAVKEAAMNITFALAIYACIQKELGLKLEFPADTGAWDANKDLSAVKLVAYFEEWAVLTSGAADQCLNIVDDSRFSYGVFWPTLASWYGLAYQIPEPDESKYLHVTMPQNPPPRGFGAPGVIKVAWKFMSWAQKPEVKMAWKKIQQRDGLDASLDPWRNTKAFQECFGTLDAQILGPWTRTESMDKARKLGWTGFVDSKEAIKEAISGLAKLKMVPHLYGQ